MTDLNDALAAAHAAHPNSEAVERLAAEVAKLKARADRERLGFLEALTYDTKLFASTLAAYANFLHGDWSDLGEEGMALIVKGIHENSANLLRQTDYYIDFLKHAEGELDAYAYPVNIAETLHEALDDLREASDRKDQTLILPEEGIVIHGDKYHLREALRCLLDNAHQFAPKGGTITVEGDKVHIMVQDDGIGIPVDGQPYVFDLFYRASNAVNRGAGVGLARAKILIEAMKGEIWLESTEGQGTIAHVTLPTKDERGDTPASRMRRYSRR